MKVISQLELRSELQAMGVAEMQRHGRFSNYTCPAESWLPTFGKYCRRYNPVSNSRIDMGELNNCNIATNWAIVEAQKAAAKNEKLYHNGYAVLYSMVSIPMVLGEDLEFKLNGIPGPCNHSTTTIRCDTGRWFFLEPQTGLFTLATPLICVDGVGIDFVFV